MNYPSEKADSLGLYVRKSFSLSGKAQHLYDAMRWLEVDMMRKKSGTAFCETMFVGYRQIADAARIDIKSVKLALQEMQTAGLVEVKFGSPIKTEKRATEIRRKSLDEIKAISLRGDGDAQRLAVKLAGRTFQFEGKLIKPFWSVSRTGRVISSTPNVQGKNAADRLAGLKAGLKDGFVLVHADIKQAEPSLIKHLLDIPQQRDLYQEIMAAIGCPRALAKKRINTLAYCRDSLACFAHWPAAAQHALGDYVQRLAVYKAELFTDSRKRRAVTTLTGRTIVAEKGLRVHPGNYFNWRIQGTVADIVNAACLHLLDSAIAIVPVHDAVYAVLSKDNATLVEAAIIERAREIGLTLNVETEVHHAR